MSNRKRAKPAQVRQQVTAQGRVLMAMAQLVDMLQIARDITDDESGRELVRVAELIYKKSGQTMRARMLGKIPEREEEGSRKGAKALVDKPEPETREG